MPGGYGQLDFGEVVVAFADGRAERLDFFTSGLTYSQLLHVEFTLHQRAEAVVRAAFARSEAGGDHGTDT
jgi:hypothetical protein